jgi:N4-gp56 family major capsid protein
MSLTAYGVNAPEAVKLWSKRLAREALKATFIQKFIGESDDSLIQLKPETGKSAGDRVTVTLRMQLTGDGVQGDGTLEGNEESLTTYTDNLLIDQLRHAVRSKGKMTQQRIPFSIRDESMSGLRDWWAGRLDAAFFNQIAGNTFVTDTRYTGNQAVVAPTTEYFPSTATADEQCNSTSFNFDLHVIDQAVAAAKTQSPVIRPLKYQGEDLYVLFMHPYQVRDLRKNTSGGQWLDIQKAAMTGGEIEKNPIFTGAVGMYNNVIIQEAFRVPNGVNSTTGAQLANVRRAVLCGAQSAAIGFGQGQSFESFDWNEELFDYGNQLGVEAGCIYGLKKLIFNSADFGVIVLPSYASATGA